MQAYLRDCEDAASWCVAYVRRPEPLSGQAREAREPSRLDTHLHPMEAGRAIRDGVVDDGAL